MTFSSLANWDALDKLFVTFLNISSSETGEVISSKIIEDQIEDTIVYGEYNGEKSNLYPAGNNGVNTSKNAKNELNRLMNGRKAIKGTSELTNTLMKDVSGQLSSSIQTLMHNQVK